MATYEAPGQGILSFLRDHPPTHYTFEVKSVKMKQEKYESDVFEAGGYKWKMIFYPNVNKEEMDVKDHVSLYLAIEDTDSLPETWEVNVDFKLFVYSQTQKKFLSFQDIGGDPIKRFHDGERKWGFPRLLEHEAFKDPTNGYLVNDQCIFGAEVFPGQRTKRSEHVYGFISKRYGVPLHGCDIPNGLLRTFRDLGPSHFSFGTKSLSRQCKNDSDVYESDIFEHGGFKWRLCLYPKGNQKRNIKKSISLYLRIVETNDLSKNWEVFATFTFFIYDHIKDRFLTVQDGAVKRFHELKEEWGLDNLISLEDFEDASNGFLVNDRCSFGTDLFVIKHHGKTVANSPVMAIPVVKEAEPIFIWEIKNLSKLADKSIYSEQFSIGGFKWKLNVSPTGNGNAKDHSMSIFLRLEEGDKLSKSLELRMDRTFRIRNQLNKSHCEKKYNDTYTSQHFSRGYSKFISLEKLNDQSLGYKKHDAVIIEFLCTSFSIHEVKTEK